MSTDAPDVAVQRAILDRLIAGYREQGFVLSCEAIALEAQPHVSGKKEEQEKAQRVSDLRAASRNQYAAAARLQQERDRLPEAEKAE